ncbi:MAG: transposase, partial [Anaerolineales bacterium]
MGSLNRRGRFSLLQEKEIPTREQEWYVFRRADLGDKFSYITTIDQDGGLIEESRLPTTKASFQRKFSALQPCRVAMEVGTHSHWANYLLIGLGHDVLVANARKLRAIYH